MKLLKTFSVMVIAGLLLASCSSIAHVEKDDAVNFSNYRTFAWVDAKEDHKKGTDLVATNVRKAVNKELEKEGWREVRNNPDVLLKYDLLVEKGVKENTNPVYSQPFTRIFFNPYTRRYGTIYYPSQFMGYDRDQYETREGTITISMIDANTDKTVWQGWTTDEVNSRNLTSKEIQSSVKSIFRKFDVAKK